MTDSHSGDSSEQCFIIWNIKSKFSDIKELPHLDLFLGIQSLEMALQKLDKMAGEER